MPPAPKGGRLLCWPLFRRHDTLPPDRPRLGSRQKNGELRGGLARYCDSCIGTMPPAPKGGRLLCWPLFRRHDTLPPDRPRLGSRQKNGELRGGLARYCDSCYWDDSFVLFGLEEIPREREVCGPATALVLLRFCLGARSAISSHDAPSTQRMQTSLKHCLGELYKWPSLKVLGSRHRPPSRKAVSVLET